MLKNIFRIAGMLLDVARITFSAFLDYRCGKLIHLELYGFSLAGHDLILVLNHAC